MRTFEQYIDESYSFRLGGSQKKGYVKIEEPKTFAELEPGDVYYIYFGESLHDQKTEKYKIYRIDDTKYYRGLVYSENGSTFSIPKAEVNSNVYLGSILVAATTFEDLQKAAKRYYHEDITEDDVRDLTDVTNEAYNFRLGGSQQKGFNQNNYKKFNELEKGDTIYYYYESKIFGHKITEALFFVELNDNSFYDSKSELSFIRKERGDNKWGCFSFEKDELTNSVIIHDEEKHFCILTTNKDEFLEQVEEHTGEKKEKIEIKNLTGKELDEAYNFRLGGSQKKGFNQNNIKSFEELENGDTMYYYWRSKDTSRTVLEAVLFDRIDDSAHNDKSVCFTRENTPPFRDKCGFVVVPKNELSKSTIIKDEKRYWCIISTSKNELLDEVEKYTGDTNIELKNYTGKVLDESYSFRLGGSQNKGYGQAAVEKSFNDLKPGDIVYWWYSSEPNNIKKIEFKKWYEPIDDMLISQKGCSYSLADVDKNKDVWIEERRGGILSGLKKVCCISLEELIRIVKEEFNVPLEKYSLRKG